VQFCIFTSLAQFFGNEDMEPNNTLQRLLVQGLPVLQFVLYELAMICTLQFYAQALELCANISVRTASSQLRKYW